jgi:hypothetical protein
LGEDKLIRKATEGLMKPAYEDLLHPAAKELGLVLGRTVHDALAPLRGLLWGWEQIEEQFIPALIERLGRVPKERIVTPPLPVAGLALEAMRFTGAEPSLRDLYAKLLATAMDRETAERAHPAFADIIRQLTPDEAKILSILSVLAMRPVISIYAFVGDGGAREEVLRHFSLLGMDGGCKYGHLVPQYLDNLCRLGLTVIPPMMRYPDLAVYEPLESHPEVMSVMAKIAADGKALLIEHQVLNVTAFGAQFLWSCVDERSSE